MYAFPSPVKIEFINNEMEVIELFSPAGGSVRSNYIVLELAMTSRTDCAIIGGKVITVQPV